jgi:hypothetical protein
LAPGLFQVEYDFFLEQVWSQEEFDAAETVEFSWHGKAERVRRPQVLGDVHYIWVEGLEVGPGMLQLVLVRRRSFRERLGSLGRGGAMELYESDASVIR